jgi:hypothetical protein
MRERFNASFAKAKRYFARNLGALFIIVFQALVLTCAFLLIRGNPAVDDVAVLAYCSLIVGVILQAVSSVREKRL